MQLNYLAWIQDQVGIAEEEIELQPAITTLGDLMDWLATRNDRFRQAFASRKAIHAAGEGMVLGEQDNIATCKKLIFFLPIAGG